MQLIPEPRAVAAMVVYLITQHGLWERPEDPPQRRLARLYNATTAATLVMGVLVFYAALLAFMTVTVAFLLDGAFLGHPPSLGDYLDISWFIASLATVGGALGSGAEDAEHRATGRVRRPAACPLGRRRRWRDAPSEGSG